MSRGRGCLPRRHSFGSESPESVTGDQVGLEREGVVDGGVSREETLGGSGGLEPLHLSLSPANRLMRVFDSVVRPKALIVASREADWGSRSAV